MCNCRGWWTICWYLQRSRLKRTGFCALHVRKYSSALKPHTPWLYQVYSLRSHRGSDNIGVCVRSWLEMDVLGRPDHRRFFFGCYPIPAWDVWTYRSSTPSRENTERDWEYADIRSNWTWDKRCTSNDHGHTIQTSTNVPFWANCALQLLILVVCVCNLL